MVNNPAYGNQGSTLIQDFVQEVDIKTGGYQAEYAAPRAASSTSSPSPAATSSTLVFVNWSPFEAKRNSIPSAFAISTQNSQNYNLDFGAELGGPSSRTSSGSSSASPPVHLAQRRPHHPEADGNGNAAPSATPTGPSSSPRWPAHLYAHGHRVQLRGQADLPPQRNHNVALAVYGNPTKRTGGLLGNANEGFVDESWARSTPRSVTRQDLQQVDAGRGRPDLHNEHGNPLYGAARAARCSRAGHPGSVLADTPRSAGATSAT